MRICAKANRVARSCARGGANHSSRANLLWVLAALRRDRRRRWGAKKKRALFLSARVTTWPWPWLWLSLCQRQPRNQPSQLCPKSVSPSLERQSRFPMRGASPLLRFPARAPLTVKSVFPLDGPSPKETQGKPKGSPRETNIGADGADSCRSTASGARTLDCCSSAPPHKQRPCPLSVSLSLSSSSVPLADYHPTVTSHPP